MANTYVASGYVKKGYIQEGIVISGSRREIFIPKFSSVLIQTVPSEIRQLDLDVFRRELKSWEDSSDGMPWPKTHSHNTTVTVGGATLARVIEIVNGYTVTFEDGPYAINLVGANSNVGDVVNVNQVSVRSANSAGLQDLNSLQAASFGGGVAIDALSSYKGTVFPVGTRAYPVNNMADAKSIAITRGLENFFVKGQLVLTSTDLSDGFIFIGDNIINTNVVIQPGADVSACEFRNMTVSGTVDNSNLIRQSLIGPITHVNGTMFQSGLIGPVVLSGGIQATFLDCYAALASDTDPIIDMGVSGQNLSVQGYKGDLTLTNMDDALNFSTINMAGGVLTLDSTLVNGTIKVVGEATVINNSTATVLDMTTNAQIAAVSTKVDAVPTEEETAAAVWAATVRELTSAMTAEELWNFLLSNPLAAGSAGEKLKQVLTTGNFIALK